MLGEENFCSSDLGGLHPFWAQQYTGADLLRKKLEQQDDFTVPEHLFSIWDSKERFHGEYVSQLIAGPNPSAPIPLNKPRNYTELNHIIKSNEQHYTFMNCLHEGLCPSYINISMSLPRPSDEVSNIINLIDRANITVIFSAGNEEELVSLDKRKYARAKQGVILVANCDSYGNPAFDSSYAPEIIVCAPGESVRSYDFLDRWKRFDGTSAAAPQVTAALSAFTAITGYSLNSREAKHLLKKTAIPHPRLLVNSNMGAGMVNTLKIGEVAFKLQKLCQEDNACYAQKLLEKDTFAFSINKQELLERTSKLFPYCSGKEGEFPEKETLVQDLRKAALLNPYDGELWSALACINRQQCLWQHNKYYASLADRTRKTDREIISDLLQDKKYEFVNRYFPLSDRKVTEELLKKSSSILEEQDDFDVATLISLARIIITRGASTTSLHSLVGMFINHPQITNNTLKILGKEISNNAKNLADHNKFLEMIINNEKIKSENLGWVGVDIAKNAENIPQHKKLLEDIISNQKITRFLYVKRIGESIAENAENITDHKKLLENIIHHPKTNAVISFSEIMHIIAKNAKKIPEHKELMEDIMNHPKVEKVYWAWLGQNIAENAENIPEHNKFLENIINVQEIGSWDLGQLGAAIIRNAENIPEHNKLLVDVVNHQNIESKELQSLGNTIAFNADKIPGHQKLLEIIIDHQRIEKIDFQWLIRGINENTEKISNHKKLLEMIKNKLRSTTEELITLLKQ